MGANPEPARGAALLEPALFEADDEGYGVVRIAEVPESLVPAADNAAANCPERAIRLET